MVNAISREQKMKTKTISIAEIEENENILSPKFYISILPKLQEEHIYSHALTNQTRKIKLNLQCLDLPTKLFIYDLINIKERNNKIIKIILKPTEGDE